MEIIRNAINHKIELLLNWIENYVLSTAANANKSIFKITDAKLYVSIVTLSAEDNPKLSKLLSEGFKRTVYWNEYRVFDNKIVEIAVNNEEKHIRELNNTTKSEKISTEQGDDYTTGCLLDFAYFE